MKKLSAAQANLLEAASRGDVLYHPYGDYYRYRNGGNARASTLRTLFKRGLIHRKPGRMGVYQPIPVEITDAGREALS